MRTSTIFLLLFGGLLLGSGCGGSSSRQERPLLLATAANVQYAMEDLRLAFEAETGIPCELVISSSGKLTAQIIQGAPYDLLVSANMLYPQTLVERGMAADTPRVYALGALVLWTLKEMDLDAGLAFLRRPGGGKIALPNPQNAPYGAEAIHALEHYDLLEEAADRLVYGESIAQANQYIMSRACEVGFTAKSTVLSPRFRDTGRWVEVNAEAYQPIRQGVVITTYGARYHSSQSRRFLQFLFSEEAQAVLERYGYRIPKAVKSGT